MWNIDMTMDVWVQINKNKQNQIMNLFFSTFFFRRNEYKWHHVEKPSLPRMMGRGYQLLLILEQLVGPSKTGGPDHCDGDEEG